MELSHQRATSASEQRTARPPARPGHDGVGLTRTGLAVVLLLLFALALGGCANSTSTASSTTTGLGSSTAGLPGTSNLQQSVVQVTNAAQPSVVEIQASGAQGGAIGSGSILRNDGYIVTNDHVVAGFSRFQVTLANGKAYPAQLAGAAPEDDLAVLKINASDLKPIQLGDSSKLVVGQFVLALGSPLGLTQSVTFGIVSALNRTASEGPNGPAGTLTGLIQTSAPINPGNSGGALVDLAGRLVGIPTLAPVSEGGAAANGIGFAIPVNRVKFITDQLIKNGRVTNTGQGFLGIQGVEVTPQLAQQYNLAADHGVLVAGFTSAANGQSPARRAGIQQGDVITQVNGKDIAGNADLAGVLLSQSPGTKVQLSVARGSGQQKITVTLGERPPSQG